MLGTSVTEDKNQHAEKIKEPFNHAGKCLIEGTSRERMHKFFPCFMKRIEALHSSHAIAPLLMRITGPGILLKIWEQMIIP